MKGALDVHRVLLEGGVPHEVVRLPRPVLSADDLPAALGLPAAQCLVVRCYLVDGAPVAVLLHAGAVPDPVALLDALGGRTLRLATVPEVNAATDCSAALVSPVGLPPEVPLLADAAVGAADVVYVATGEGGVALGIRTRDLLVATGARAARLSTRPLPASARPWDGSDLALQETAEAAPAPVVDLDARRSAG